MSNNPEQPMKEHLTNRPAQAPAQAPAQQYTGTHPADFNTDDLAGGFQEGYAQAPPMQDTVKPGHVARPRIDAADIYSKFELGSFLSHKGLEYMQNLRAALADRNIQGHRIQIVPLSRPTSAIAIKCAQFAMLIIFEEALPNNNVNLPKIAYMHQAYAAYASEVNDGSLVHSHCIVSPEDYDEQYQTAMVTVIHNRFLAALNESVKSMTVDYLSGYNLEVNYNPDVYDYFERQCNPHANRPRADIKMTIRAVKNNHSYNNNRNVDFADATATHSFDIGTISAYTDFIEHNDSVTRHFLYQPHIHFTMNARIPDFVSTAILMVIAKTHLIDSGNWTMPFKTFAADRPNIGNLVDDLSTGSPFFVSNPASLEEMIGTNTIPPILMLDTADGRSCIPGVEYLNKDNSVLIDMFNSYIPNLRLPTDTTLGSFSHSEHTGVITIGSEKADSSNADFLNLMMIYKNRKEELRELLRIYPEPVERVEVIRKYFSDFRLIYSKAVTMLNLNTLTMIQNAINARGVTIPTVAYHQGTMDSTPYVNTGRNYASSYARGTGMVGGGAVNPMQGIYGAPSTYFNRY